MAMVELDQMKFELQSYENTLHEVKDSLDLEGKKKRIEELEMEMEAPGFWDDPDSSNRKMKELKNLKDTAELCNKLETQYSDIETLMLLVAAGIGITIAPESAIKYVRQSSDLVFIPLIGEYEHVDIMVIWKEDNQNPALPVFIDVLKKDAVEKGIIQG